MAWTWRRITSLPNDWLFSNRELNGTTVYHHILVVEPVLVPLFPIDLHRLYVKATVAEAVGFSVARDAQSSIFAERDVDIGEPWRF